MKEKNIALRKSLPEVPLQSGWDIPDINKLNLRYNYGNSIVAEFVSGHDHADVLSSTLYIVSSVANGPGKAIEGQTGD